MINKLKEFGINKIINKKIYPKLGINTRRPAVKLKSTQIVKTEDFFKKIQLKRGKFLKEQVKKNIDFLINLKNYKGNRHKLNYPVRGQRTHTNAKTRNKFKI